MQRLIAIESMDDKSISFSTSFILQYAYPESAGNSQNQSALPAAQEVTDNSLKTTFLMAYYVGIFVFAEAAFVFMALREYVQDLLGITDVDVIRGKMKIV